MIGRRRPAALWAAIRPQERVEEIRRLLCPHYEECLGEALGRDWASWTCVGCELFAADAADAADARCAEGEGDLAAGEPPVALG
jgi:hypothetical protein